MATDTEPPPPAAPLPPWRQELLLRRRRDGKGVVTATRPPPPTPAPHGGGGGGVSAAPDSRRPTSRYIDAFGEIVGLPSPRGACEGPSPSASDANVEELQYGPGIVSRLRSRYLSMAEREAAGGGADAMRRAASLQDLLSREGAFERGAVQDSYLLTGGGALTAPVAWGESIRKAKSVGDLISQPPPPRPAGAASWRPQSDNDGRWRVTSGHGPPEERSGGEKTPAARSGGEKTPAARSGGEKTPAARSGGTSKKTVRSGGDCDETVRSGDCERTLKAAARPAETGDKSVVVRNRPVAAANRSIKAGDRSVAADRPVSPVTTMKADSGGPQDDPQPLQESCLVRKSSLPAADTVITVKRLLESAAGGGRPSPDAAPSEKGAPDDWCRPVAADAAHAASGDDVTAGLGRLMTVSDATERWEGADEVTCGQAPPPPAGRQVGVIRPRQTATPGGQEELDRRHNALNQAKNGQLAARRGETIVVSGLAAPLRAKNMVGMLMNSSRSGRRGDKTIITGPVMKGGPLTKASLAAEMKRNSRPVSAADLSRSGSIQAVNARLISAASEVRSPGSGEAPPATNGVAPPANTPLTQTIAWHQQANNSTLYNFTDRCDVPDYVEDDGMDIHRPAKPKQSDTAYVLLPGFDPGQTSDEDLVVTLVQPEEPPPVCPVTFSNDGVIINGHSSLLQQPREGTRVVSFSEASPSVYRYPSQASVLAALPPEPAVEPRQSDPDSETDEEDVDGHGDQPVIESRLGNTVPSGLAGFKPSTLSTYTSSRLTSDEAAAFQLGVTRTSSRPPPPSVPAPQPPAAAAAPAQPDEEDVAWSAENTADMLF